MRPTTVFFFLILAVIIASFFGFGAPVAVGAIAIAALLILYLYSSLVSPFYVTWYTIHKGWHYSIQGLFSMLFPFVRTYNSRKKNLFIKFRLPEKCSYEVISGVNDHWNKLRGVAFRGGVHGNSIRLVWRPTKDGSKYEICFYSYVGGYRIVEPEIYTFSWNTDYIAVLSKNDFRLFNSLSHRDDYDSTKPIAVFSFIKISSFVNTKYRFILDPFFGGKGRRKTAPRKINIFIETKLI